MRRQVKCWHVPPMHIDRFGDSQGPCRATRDVAMIMANQPRPIDHSEQLSSWTLLLASKPKQILWPDATDILPVLRHRTRESICYIRYWMKTRWCWFLAEILKWWRIVVPVNRRLASAVQCGTWEAATSGQGRFSGTRRESGCHLSTESRCRCLIRKGMTFPCLLSAVGKV
jgi:hypothetical protein